MLKNILALAATFTLAAHADRPINPEPQKPVPTEPEPAKKPEPKAAPAKPAQSKAKPADKPAPPQVAAKTTEPVIKEATPDAPGSQKIETPQVKVTVTPPAQPEQADLAPELQEAKEEQKHLAILNALAAEQQKHDSLDLRTEIAHLKLQKELLIEKMALAAARENEKHADDIITYQAEKEKLTRDAVLAKLRADQLGSQLKEFQASSALKTTALMAEISQIETAKKRDDYANAKPQYLANPLTKDGTLVISDRRIPFNGPVTSKLADKVTERINYFNNKDPKTPIFIVIDDSPGGSVMAGYRILKSMEGSTAPVYVVVKSFAASMAASITTLAEKSFVYPNAIIMHHQISQTFAFSSMNLTEQQENVDDLTRWWNRLADPIAQKMGITSDEFIEMMYKKTVSGDWSEFGDDAVKLKWADHTVSRIHETALLKNPDAKKATPPTIIRKGVADNGLTPATDDNGNPYMILPRRNPKDVYMMHNPDNYYRFK